jgi:Fur family ferric uptake transcriptional regulator
MTPSEVISEVERSDVHVNQSTIYRALSDLRDAGLVSESRFGSGEASYEWILDQNNHHHVHCTGCGETVELDEAPVRRFLSDIARESDFEPDTRHLVITGLCRRCQAN